MVDWRRCRSCNNPVDRDLLAAHAQVCPICGHHGHWSVQARFAALLDADSFAEYDADLASDDPLTWAAEGRAYRQTLERAAARAQTGESFVYGRAQLGGRSVWAGAFEFRFMGGTLGTVAGEKIARMIDHAVARHEPAIIWTASGGARMQEGMYSLLQMAKNATQLARLQAARVPLVTVVCHPTTGGVAASLALRGDVVLAEPGALVGFSGPRVVLQTIGEEMPPGIQLSDRLCEDGFVDELVPRAEQRARLLRVLARFQVT